MCVILFVWVPALNTFVISFNDSSQAVLESPTATNPKLDCKHQVASNQI